MRTPPPFPHNEAERLARLRLLEVLDTGPEPIFDALTRTASLICDAPIALLSLVDADRQWFKSSVGLEGVSETPRELAFCAHAILQTDVMEVPDARQDARFHDNPLVTSAPDIRFYAGAPVVMPGGQNIGTLCVIDRKPKELSPHQRAVLENLAQVAAHALDMRKKALELDHFNTDLLQRAHALHAKEVLYQAIVEDQTDMISLALPTGELTFVNEAYAAHFGKKPQEMVGHNLLDFVAPQDKDAVNAHLRTVCAAPGVAMGENQMRSTGGDARWVAWTNRSIGDETGRVIGLHSVGRDITDKKRGELALRASHERYRALYESTPAMMHSIDAQGRILFVSDKWLQTMGYLRDEVIGRPSTDFFTPASKAYAQAVVIPAFFESGRCEDIAYQLVRKDGSILDVLLSAVLEDETPDRPAHSLAVLQDVTEKNALARELRTQEERLNLATSVNEIGIWEIDLATGRLEWSDTMFRIFGGERSTFKGQLEDWSSKVYPEDIARSEQAFAKALQTHAPMDFDFRVVREGGRIRYVNARAVVIKDAQGKATRVLGTNYDVTDRKAIESALEYSEKRLRTIADNLPVLISHMDTDFRYTFTNNNYQNWYALQDPIDGKTVAEVFGDAVFQSVKPHIAAALAGESVTFELRSEVPNSPRHLLVHYVPDKDADGVIRGVFGMVQDRTESHLARERLEDSERQLRAVTDSLPVLISYVDQDERVHFLNATFRDWLGVDLAWAQGRKLREVIGDALYGQRGDYLKHALRGERIEFAVESTTQGITRHLQATYIPDIRPDGEVRGAFALSTDVTALKLAELELRRLVRIDSLTGLPNRRYFDEKLQEAIARSKRTRQIMALMFLDVDHFKSINDTLGHGLGDQVLCEFAHRLRSSVRTNDFAARLAGDEFVILIEGVATVEEIEVVAHKVIAQVRQPMTLSGHEVSVTTSIGIAVNDAEDINSDALINRADKALYRAKAAGRDRYALEHREA